MKTRSQFYTNACLVKENNSGAPPWPHTAVSRRPLKTLMLGFDSRDFDFTGLGCSLVLEF